MRISDWSSDVCSSDLRRGNPAIIIERTMSAQGVSSPMNKNELVEAVAASSGLSKADAGRALDAVVGSITGALKAGESVNLIGFGTFDVRARAARTGRNPRTSEEIQIAAAKNPAFKAGKALKDAVN